MLLAARTLPEIEGEPDDAYTRRIIADSRAEGIKAAKRGTQIHAAIEVFYRDGTVDTDYAEYLTQVTAVITNLCGYRHWEPERSFAHELGYGGKTDLFCRGDDPWLLDFKTKEFGPWSNEKERAALLKKLAWDEQAIQLVAYKTGHKLPDETRVANIYISRTHPIALAHEWPREGQAKWWAMFHCLLAYWQLVKDYDSSFQVEIEADAFEVEF